MEENWVTYNINESFLGYKATELVIPTWGGTPVWAVKIIAPADKLADSIYKFKKHKIYIKSEADTLNSSGKAILFEKQGNTFFYCYVNEGND